MKTGWKNGSRWWACCALGAVTALVTMGASECNSDWADSLLDPSKPLLDSSAPLTGVVAVRELIKYEWGNDNEVRIKSYFGDEVLVNSKALLSSRDIEKIEAVARPNDTGFFDLRLTLTQTGRKRWIGFTTRIQDNVALVIDDVMYRPFRAVPIVDGTTLQVMISARFDESTAKLLQDNAARNHRRLNQTQE